jgi:hypothetical protein
MAVLDYFPLSGKTVFLRYFYSKIVSIFHIELYRARRAERHGARR